MITAIRFLNIILVALVSGIQLGIWLGYNPKNFSAGTYLEQQQGAIKALNTLMPVLGLITIVLTCVSAYQQKDDKSTVAFLLIAAALLVISGLVTKFGNQPINSVVITWSADSMPGNWTELRDKWWSYHIVRMLTSIMALALILWAGLKK